MTSVSKSGLVVLVLLTASACGGRVSRGHDLYAAGYYVDAAHVFERSERHLPTWDPQERAEYGLYRGLSLMALGDLAQAERWLRYAGKVDAQHPGSLDAGQKELASRALFDVAQRRNAPPGPGAAYATGEGASEPEAPRPNEK